MCGCRLMVGPQLPKLKTRVRFPSPAPQSLQRSGPPMSGGQFSYRFVRFDSDEARQETQRNHGPPLLRHRRRSKDRRRTGQKRRYQANGDAECDAGKQPASGKQVCSRGSLARIPSTIAVGRVAALSRQDAAPTGMPHRPACRQVQQTRPAAYPEAQAHWKLNPPRCPVTSTTSPTK